MRTGASSSDGIHDANVDADGRPAFYKISYIYLRQRVDSIQRPFLRDDRTRYDAAVAVADETIATSFA